MTVATRLVARTRRVHGGERGADIPPWSPGTVSVGAVALKEICVAVGDVVGTVVCVVVGDVVGTVVCVVVGDVVGIVVGRGTRVTGGMVVLAPSLTMTSVT